MIKAFLAVVLWGLGAVVCAACGLFLYEAWLVYESGVPVASLPLEALAWTVLDYPDYLAYAAIAGAVLGLVSLVPAVIRENAERLLVWSVFGAVSGAVSVMCAMFLYNVYKLANSGVAADAIPFLQLVTEVMELHRFAPAGAVAGTLLAFVSVAITLLRAEHVRSTGPAGYQTHLDDPDRMIRSRRAKRAEEYLATREDLDPDLGRL